MNLTKNVIPFYLAAAALTSLANPPPASAAATNEAPALSLTQYLELAQNDPEPAKAGGTQASRSATGKTDPDATEPSSLYQPNELSLDAFGSVSIGQHIINHFSPRRVVDGGQLGAGAGINYFFCRFLGFGADAYSENTRGVFIDHASGSLIGRLPLGESGLAPYVLAGGGYDFEARESFAQLGGGIEYRFVQHLGVFADARYVLADHAPNYGLARFGLRFSF